MMVIRLLVLEAAVAVSRLVVGRDIVWGRLARRRMTARIIWFAPAESVRILESGLVKVVDGYEIVDFREMKGRMNIWVY